MEKLKFGHLQEGKLMTVLGLMTMFISQYQLT